MPLGFETAVEEVTLVLFTTLAPSGVIACALMALVVIFAPLGSAERTRISHAMALPIAVSMIGLIASATHLGNPANALYVFMGVGRSPLSNEVFAAVIFLIFCGAYWLFSFSENQRVGILKLGCAAIFLSGLACVEMISLAYDAPSISTWSTPYVPLNIWFCALSGGPLLAMLGLRIARAVCLHTWVTPLLVTISAVSLAANGAVLYSQSINLATIWGSYGYASELVPHYDAMIISYLLVAGTAIASVAFVAFRKKVPSILHLALATGAFFAGLFIVRFAFYMMHMTAGMGV